MENKIKALHITHNDADAVGCAVIVELMSNKYEWRHVYCNTTGASNAVEKIFFDNEEYKRLIISDIFITDETAEKLDEYIKNHPDVQVELIDHHKTNKLPEKYSWAYVRSEENGTPVSATWNIYEKYKDEIKATHDNGYSIIAEMTEEHKTKITHDWVNSVNVKKTAWDISRYDTWEWKNNPRENPTEDEFMILTKMGGCEFAFSHVMNYIDNSCKWDSEALTIISLYRDADMNAIEAVKEHGVKNTIIVLARHEYRCALMLCDDIHGNSQLAWLNENIPDIDMSVGLYVKTHSVSLRTINKEIDVSKIAKAMGGGGHTSAAGFQAKRSLFLKLLNKYYLESEGM